MKELNALGFDNTEKQILDSDKNSRMIALTLGIKKDLSSFGQVTVGEMAYNCNGYRPGKVEEICDGNTIVIHGSFHRKNEWKGSPWTKEEVEAFNSHSLKASIDLDKRTKNALKNFK